MHNTTLENLEFQLQFSTTNLRYLLGEPAINKKLIKQTKERIASIQKKIETEKKLKTFS